ncbi:hypothetical protein KCP76_18970 [Salmonella enterica subsp. enterica serovar Weltevreden]|nr:hypothetical protein KCP76_18970 [Salmonella enterica subsp. enterica serovar Weltevreden]
MAASRRRWWGDSRGGRWAIKHLRQANSPGAMGRQDDDRKLSDKAICTISGATN